jgi:CheY-like chemotaxis protein
MEVSAFIANMQKTCCDLRYKLVLTDLNMPVMDGFDAARLILSYCQENFLSVPVAAVTAYDNQSTYDTCIKIGMVAVMNKPISILMLEKIVKKYYFKE